MSSPEIQEIDHSTPIKDVVVGYLSAAAIFAGIACLFYSPLKVGPVAMLVALVAAGMGGGQRRIAAWAVAVATTGWLLGMTLAVLLSRDIF